MGHPEVILAFKEHIVQTFLGLGFSPEIADEQAWHLAGIILDKPDEVKLAPHAVYTPGSRLPPMRTSAINSDRIRHVSGVAIVIDMVAFKRAWDEKRAENERNPVIFDDRR
jgi:hypothetical protein